MENSLPKIVCHMMTALDGKITGPFMDTEIAEIVGEEYERTNNTYRPQAWLCGRVTTDENFTFYRKPDLEEQVSEVPGGDFVAVKEAGMYYVSVDASGWRFINWTFLQAGLVDELSLVITPVADGENNTVTLFEKSDGLPAHAPVGFTLKSVDILNGGGVWLRYLVKK